MNDLLKIFLEVLVVVLALGLIKHWITRVEVKIDEAVSVKDCDERRKNVCKKITALKESDDEQWQVINRHGHKGLDGDDNLVTRYV